MSTQLVTALTDGHVLTLRLNRIDKRNALNAAMYRSLADHFERAAADPTVRVIVLTAQPDCFCSGNDVDDFLQDIDSSGVASAIQHFMQALTTCPKPVIAAVAGIAIGIGATLLLHCDLVYCGENTRLQFPFTTIGLCPEFGSTYLLPRLVGMAKAAELLMLGAPLDAEEALRLGLVTMLAPNAEVESLAQQKAAKLAGLAPAAVQTTKRLLRRWLHDRSQEAIQAEAEAFTALLQQSAAREAFEAFTAKGKNIPQRD